MRILIIAGMITLALIRMPEALGCECGNTGAIACFKDASVIFEGQVESMQIRTHALFEGMTLTNRTIAEYTVFIFKLGRVYKGAPPKSVRVATGIGTADGTAAPDCSFPFEIGRKYLVYAFAGIPEYGGLLYTNICSGTNPMSDAGPYLRHLQGKPPMQEYKLPEKPDYESRTTAKISGKLYGIESDKNAYLEYGVWRFQAGEWRRAYESHEISDASSYAFSGLEPGEYKIGFFQKLGDGSRKIGFYGGGERVQDGKTIMVGPKDQLPGIDIRLLPPSSHTIQGKIECKDGVVPDGKIKLRVANSWDRNRTTMAVIRPCEAFEIPGVYSGEFRVIPTLELDRTDSQDAWSIAVPEIAVPETTRGVVLRLEREKLAQRATALNYRMWDLWSGKVSRILDGDRILLELDSGDSRVLRIANIGCPDQEQEGWEKAKNFTTRQLLGKNVTFFILQDESSDTPLQYEDTPGTLVGLPTEAANTLAAELLTAGLAWHYTKYSADPDLARFEAEARKAGRGIWSKPNPVPPWDYRKTAYREQ